MTRAIEVIEDGPVFGKCPVVSAQMSPCWGDLREHLHQPEAQPDGWVTVQCEVCGGLYATSRSAVTDSVPRPVSRVFGETGE